MFFFLCWILSCLGQHPREAYIHSIQTNSTSRWASKPSLNLIADHQKPQNNGVASVSPGERRRADSRWSPSWSWWSEDRDPGVMQASWRTLQHKIKAHTKHRCTKTHSHKAQQWNTGTDLNGANKGKIQNGKSMHMNTDTHADTHTHISTTMKHRYHNQRGGIWERFLRNPIPNWVFIEKRI